MNGSVTQNPSICSTEEASTEFVLVEAHSIGQVALTVMPSMCTKGLSTLMMAASATAYATASFERFLDAAASFATYNPQHTIPSAFQTTSLPVFLGQ